MLFCHKEPHLTKLGDTFLDKSSLYHHSLHSTENTKKENTENLTGSAGKISSTLGTLLLGFWGRHHQLHPASSSLTNAMHRPGKLFGVFAPRFPLCNRG